MLKIYFCNWFTSKVTKSKVRKFLTIVFKFVKYIVKNKTSGMSSGVVVDMPLRIIIHGRKDQVKKGYYGYEIQDNRKARHL